MEVVLEVENYIKTINILKLKNKTLKKRKKKIETRSNFKF
jgi:hypothetical protein|tara:strand:+ start:408 stop:527 length:120 start_codon:yes stop_codon:yes gene_type:complete